MGMGHLPQDGGDELGSVFSEINITPLTDIFLVLLIIFMVGASMAVEAAAGGSGDSGNETSGLQIDLPRGGAQNVASPSNDVSVAILSDGRVIFGGEELSDDDLESKLAQARGDREGATLIVQADEGVPHGRVIAVMERARKVGFARLAVATRGAE